MPKKAQTGVQFNAKASWQKDDCLFCPAESTLQADYGRATIRCCTKDECMRRAAKLAKDTG